VKGQIKYKFSRLIVLLVALIIFDTSIDIDHVTAIRSSCYTAYDDIDSFSEFIVESMLGNNDLLKEGKNDDRHPTEKTLNKCPSFIFYMVIEPEQTRSITRLLPPSWPLNKNTRIQFEDYSHSDYIPPDACLNPA
jgi:hypothetical protein